MDQVAIPLNYLGTLSDLSADNPIEYGFYINELGEIFVIKAQINENDDVSIAPAEVLPLNEDWEQNSKTWGMVAAAKSIKHGDKSNYYIYEDLNGDLHLSHELTNGEIKIYKATLTTDAEPLLDSKYKR